MTEKKKAGTSPFDSKIVPDISKKPRLIPTDLIITAQIPQTHLPSSSGINKIRSLIPQLGDL